VGIGSRPNTGEGFKGNALKRQCGCGVSGIVLVEARLAWGLWHWQTPQLIGTFVDL
jgi:hypothetical protein